jgi:Spy/CpxP family protein refolding chaperone
MRKAILVLFTILFVMGLAVNSGAAEKEKGSAPHGDMYKHEGGCGCGGPHSIVDMFKKLGLDEKQKEAIKAIHFRTKKDIIRKRADLQVAKIELQEILSKDPVDMTAAETAVKKAEGLRAEMKMLHIKAIEEIKSNLNAEQKKEFSSMIRHIMMKREMMRHGMRHGMMEGMRHGMRDGKCHCDMHGKGHMQEKGKMKGEMKHDEQH